MYKRYLIIGSLGMALAVIAGAFSAHALRGLLESRMWEIFNTAVEYQVYHSLGILLIGILIERNEQNSTLQWSGLLMTAGMIIFSGSLYLIVATGIKMLGMITPIGGFLMIVAWLLLAWSQAKR